MAPEFSSDLIRDIQIRLRRAAGVPSYDPGDPTLPPVTSIDEAVAALDPSIPDYLRCRRCHGRLPGGINSTICIFCGEEQRGEGIAVSMCFNSTAAYRNLLRSLDLDGSEIVNFENESKGFDSSKGNMTLSTLLNFELKWSQEREIEENSTNLSGINLDNFFSGTRNETAFDSQIPNLFESHGSLDEIDQPKRDEFDEWETDFQVAIDQEISIGAGSTNLKDDDSFDGWRDFAQTAGRELFGGDSSSATAAGDVDDVEFGSFKQSDSFMHALGDLQSSSEGKNINGVASMEDRWEENYDKTRSSSITQRTCDTREDVPESRADLLLAQTSDLLFMLEETLSLPKKSNT